MAGSRITTGLRQSLHVKLETITDTLMSSSTFADFVGAGKIIDPTSAATFIANIAGVVDGDQSFGGAATTVDISEQTFGNASYITGFTMDPLDFELIRDRTNTFKKAMEDVSDSVDCWMAWLSQNVPGHAGAAANASIIVGWGTISTHVVGRVTNPSVVMVHIAPEHWLNTIDA